MSCDLVECQSLCPGAGVVLCVVAVSKPGLMGVARTFNIFGGFYLSLSKVKLIINMMCAT